MSSFDRHIARAWRQRSARQTSRKGAVSLAFGVFELLDGCERTPVAQQVPAPTATEVFHLRGECARLAEKMLEDNVVGSALTQSAWSHYDQKANRCHVELTVQSADLQAKPYYINRTLFDGQTHAMLAFTRYENGVETAMAFGIPDVVTHEQVNSYINETMKDD